MLIDGNYNEETKKFYLPGNEQTYEDYFKQIKDKTKKIIIAEINGIKVKFSNNSKKIKFIGNGYNEEIFIANQDQVLYLIKLFEFKKYKIIKKDGKIKDVMSDYLDFDEIRYCENDLDENDFIKANIAIETGSTIFLSSLSLSFYDYQKNDFSKINGEFELTQERMDFFNELEKLINEKSFIPICGPKSIGKSISILYFCKTYIQIRYFYINLTHCKQLFMQNKEEIFSYICKELYNCLPFNSIHNVFHYISRKHYKNIMEIILDVMNYLEQNFSSRSFFVVIDQYKQKLDINYFYIKEIKLKADTNFKVLVCSSLNEYDFRKSLDVKLNDKNEFYLNYLFVNKLICVSEDKLKDFTNEEKDLLKRSGNLFIYYQKILHNQSNSNKNISEIKKEIIDYIIKEINEYFVENDDKKKTKIIKEIHDIIDKKQKFIDLKNKLHLFPLKFFNISFENKNFFIIDDLSKETELIIQESYPIVIEAINQIYKSSLYKLKQSAEEEITINTEKSKQSSELEEEFNEFLWFYRKDKKYYDCNLINKIRITSLMNMNEDDSRTIINALENIQNPNDSILITQTHQNAEHYDTSILKLNRIDNNQKIFDLYLFQETLKKPANKRLTELTLNEDKTLLKFIFFIKCNIEIDNIYFSYVFDEKSPDTTTINYCNELKLNYLLFKKDSYDLINCSIDPKIKSRFFYPMNLKEKEREEYLINYLDVDYSLKKEELSNQYCKLKEFLNKKRDLLKNKYKQDENLKVKIKSLQNDTNIEFRNKEIEEKSIEEKLMNNEKDDIIGISYIVDESTQIYLNEINFSKNELNNLYNLMGNYSSDLKILKIIKLDKIPLKGIPYFDCAIILVNDNVKSLVNIKTKQCFSLSEKRKIATYFLEGTFYLIKFISNCMISKKVRLKFPSLQEFYQ